MSDAGQPANDGEVPAEAVAAAKAYDHEHRNDGLPYPKGWLAVSDRQVARLLTGAAEHIAGQARAAERAVRRERLLAALGDDFGAKLLTFLDEDDAMDAILAFRDQITDLLDDGQREVDMRIAETARAAERARIRQAAVRLADERHGDWLESVLRLLDAPPCTCPGDCDLEH